MILSSDKSTFNPLLLDGITHGSLTSIGHPLFCLGSYVFRCIADFISLRTMPWSDLAHIMFRCISNVFFDMVDDIQVDICVAE